MVSITGLRQYVSPIVTLKPVSVTNTAASGLVSDVVELSNVAKLRKLAEKILGRNLNTAGLDRVVDIEHSLPNSGWNGTVNIANESIRQGYIGPEIKKIIEQLDSIMTSAQKTQFDAVVYRGEAYNAKNKHFAKILELKPGDKFTDNTYRYITDNPGYAANFASSRDVTVTYNYILPKGSTCIGTCEKTCALLPKETVSEILSVDKSNPKNIVINAILRTP